MHSKRGLNMSIIHMVYAFTYVQYMNIYAYTNSYSLLIKGEVWFTQVHAYPCKILTSSNADLFTDLNAVLDYWYLWVCVHWPIERNWAAFRSVKKKSTWMPKNMAFWAPVCNSPNGQVRQKQNWMGEEVGCDERSHETLYRLDNCTLLIMGLYSPIEALDIKHTEYTFALSQ